ncbi:hypothetical protein DRQ16_04610, partial [bacterium]
MRRKVLFLLFFAGALYGDMMLKEVRYRCWFEITGEPAIGEEFTLTLKTQAVRKESPNTRIEFNIPEGVKPLPADVKTTYSVTIPENQTASTSINLKIERPGYYQISALVTATDDDTVYWPYGGANLFVFVNWDTVIYADTSLGIAPYNIELDTLVLKEMQDSLSKWREAKGILPEVRIYGRIRYEDKENGGYTNASHILLVLSAGPVVSGIPFVPVDMFYANEDGTFDKTYSLLPGNYTFWVCAQNPDAHIEGFLSPLFHCLKRDNFNVYLSDQDREYNWDIMGDDADKVQILINISESKRWALEHFGFTKDFAWVVYPNPFSGSFYFPIWDRIFLTQGSIWGESGRPGTTHEWAHALMCETFNNKIPYGWGWGDHWLSKITNSGFAFAEGFAEFVAYAVWVEKYGEDIG